MQDLSTGELKPLNLDLLNGVPPNTRAYREALQKACDQAQPDRSKQGPIFQVGEVLELRGGRFQITKVEPGRMVLRGLPR